LNDVAEVNCILLEGILRLPFSFSKSGGDTESFLSFMYTAKEGTTLPFNEQVISVRKYTTKE